MKPLTNPIILGLCALFLLAAPAAGAEAQSQTITCDPAEPCWICDPTLREKGRLWCKEHTRYEDRCWLCHPELKEEGRIYCTEHGVYEDECTICRPELLRQHPDDRQSRTGQPRQRLECREHAVFEDECAICHPDLTSTLAAGDELKIRFASKTSAAKAGVETAAPEPVSGAQHVAVYAEIAYDRNHLARVTPLAGGIVRRVLVDVGQDVGAGEVLVEIASTAVSSAKQTFVQALLERRLSKQEHQRQQRLAAERVAAERHVQQAEAAFERAKVTASSARQALRNLGLDEAAIDAVEDSGSTDPLLQIRAPFAGTVIDRTVVQGETVERGVGLLQVADLSRMWLELSVPEDHLADLRHGQAVEARFSALPDLTVTGQLDWIAAGVDQRSRMLPARAVVDNPERLLRAGLYGKAVIEVGAEQNGFGVPIGSVRRLERQPFVFVRLADDLYVARRVELGPRLGERVLVSSGLSADDPVVVGGTHVVFSEMYKSKLGAGCVDE